MPDDNKRETGARAPRSKSSSDSHEEFSQQAAANKQPSDKYGNTAPLDEAEEKVRHSDGQSPAGSERGFEVEPGGSEQPGYRMKKRSPRPVPSPATEKASGAGQEIAERSKDAKAPKPDRRVGA